MIVRPTSSRSSRQQGFSLIELMMVVVVASILSAMTVPQAVQMMHVFRLSNATSQFSGLIQNARSASVRDSRSYSVYFISAQPITEAFVGVKGTMFDYVNDPITTWAQEVTPKPMSSAPATSSLQTAAFLSGSNSSSALVVEDGYVTAGSTGITGITFSAMGQPCIPSTTSASRVCNTATSNANVAYWVFFQNNVSGTWQALTVTPAGRIQRWIYNNNWASI